MAGAAGADTMTKEERIKRQRERLEEMKKPEALLHARGYRYIAGVDEVGRGPLAGPVVAAAVVLPEDFNVLGVDDSKKLSEKKREELYDAILEGCLAYGIGMADHQVIDEINILQATKKAMREAIARCEEMLGGLDYLIFDAVTIEDLKLPQEAVVKGDAKVLAVAAASIVAKVTRDRMMEEYDNIFPGYGFASNKGYGSAEHIAALKKLGATPIHRQSFIKNFIGTGK